MPIPALMGPSQQCACNTFVLVRMEIICRHASLNQRLHRFMRGLGGIQGSLPKRHMLGVYLSALSAHHSVSVKFCTLGFRLFFILLERNSLACFRGAGALAGDSSKESKDGGNGGKWAHRFPAARAATCKPLHGSASDGSRLHVT